jgi:hypothetical protein
MAFLFIRPSSYKFSQTVRTGEWRPPTAQRPWAPRDQDPDSCQ